MSDPLARLAKSSDARLAGSPAMGRKGASVGRDKILDGTLQQVVKNKVAPPFRQCEFDIMYGKGISKEGSLLDVGVDLEIVKKAGAWFTYEGEQLGQGRGKAP